MNKEGDLSQHILKQLLEENGPPPTEQVSPAQRQHFAFQLELLKLEIDLIDRNMSRRETVTQAVKNFAIVGWVAAVTIVLGQAELRRFVIVTALLPLMFWFVDAWWLYRYRGNTVRNRIIQDYVNSQDFAQSFQRQQLFNFSLLDISARLHRGTKIYTKHVNFWRVFRFTEMVLLYGGLILISLVIGIIALSVF